MLASIAVFCIVIWVFAICKFALNTLKGKRCIKTRKGGVSSAMHLASSFILIFVLLSKAFHFISIHSVKWPLSGSLVASGVLPLVPYSAVWIALRMALPGPERISGFMTRDVCEHE
jgi:hypothetical protein